MLGAWHGRSLSSILLFLAAAATLLLSLLLGGGQGSRAEDLLALAGLGLIAAATHRALARDMDPKHLRWLFGLPAALLALPVLQLVPLPPAIWTHLPGRGPLVADMAAAGVTPGWAPWSLDPLATERILWSAMVPIGLFMAASVLRSRDRRHLVYVVLAFAGLSVFVGLWQLMDGPGSGLYFYEITNRNAAVGFFANRNHLASLLAVSLPLAASLLSDRLREVRHGVRDLRVWLLTALIVVLAVGVTATVSRAGLVMLMLSIVAGAIVMWRGRRDVPRGAKVWGRIAAGVAALLVLQFTLYALLQRFQSDPLEDARWDIARNTVAAAAPARGTGWGLGTFVQAYDEIGDVAADQSSYVNHAHDDYLELWLEAGVPALLLCGLALSIVLLRLVQQMRNVRAGPGTARRNRALLLGATLGLTLVLLHSFADYPLRTATMAAVAALLAAFLPSGGILSSRDRRRAGVDERLEPDGSLR